jgi:hypothetical protein
MPFDAIGKLRDKASSLGNVTDTIAKVKDITDTIADAAMEESQKVLGQINLLLQLLQSAGYCIASLDIELNVPPKVTVNLETGPAVKEEKLGEILRDHAGQSVIATVLTLLIQANKLRGSVTVETLELEGIQIILAPAPNITLQWKDKGRNKK